MLGLANTVKMVLVSRWETRSRERETRGSIKIHIPPPAHLEFGLTSANSCFRKDCAFSVSAFPDHFLVLLSNSSSLCQ